MHIVKKSVITVLAILFAMPQSALAAAVFNPNYIISDNDLTDKDAMSVTQIQKLLTNKNSSLVGYKTQDPGGNTKTAAQIIYDASQYYRISPKYILTTVQKEQSLVEDQNPTQYQYDWATGYGVCDSCSVNDPAIQKYKGFFNQINWSAKRNRYYIDTAGQWNFKVGNAYTIDDQTVTMQNQATVNLYTYTPHLHGNLLFWTIWNRWFAKNYPDGTLLQVQGENGVYLIQNGVRRPFVSRTALVSRFNPNNIILVSKSEMDAYQDGLPINFANYSLVRNKENKRVYLIDGDLKRYITSPDVFRSIGFNPEEIIVATAGELAPYADGTNITMQSIYPTGVLLQSKETGGISYVEDGIRHSIMSKEILKSRFPTRKPVVVNQTSIDQFPKADPIKFKEGDLVTSPNANGVYVISNGLRRGIASKQAFDTLGYRWKNIIHTTDAALFIHSLGDPIDITK